MPHSYNKIWIHALWSTKKQQPLINESIENKLYYHITQELRNLGCPSLIINGTKDHIHCLFLLNPQKNIAETIKQIKGSSSHFINHHELIPEKFSWQTGYACFSISESMVEKVENYIKAQKGAHQNKTFQQEMDDFLKLYQLNQIV